MTDAMAIIAIGASTGGTEAIKQVLVRMPSEMPAIVITQHMPKAFTKSFAGRLDSLCRIGVKEAEHNERILPGHAYIAPGHAHLLLGRSSSGYVAVLEESPPLNHHRPSVDMLFRSVAENAGRHATGVILTGMGKDGAQGMLEMHEAGAYNFAQDEASCVVYGMPREAVALGAVDEIVPLAEITSHLLQRLSRQAAAS